MVCKYCGHELPEKSKFCIFCGNIIQHPEEMPVKIVQNKPVKKDQFEEYKPKQDSMKMSIPTIDIIDIEESKKEPMQHNAEKLKLIQDVEQSNTEFVEPNKEEILEIITNNEEPVMSIEELELDNSIEETELSEEVKEPILESTENIENQKPEIVYLKSNNLFGKSNKDKENKVLNIMIIVFAALAVVLALKTFIF